MGARVGKLNFLVGGDDEAVKFGKTINGYYGPKNFTCWTSREWSWC